MYDIIDLQHEKVESGHVTIKWTVTHKLFLNIQTVLFPASQSRWFCDRSSPRLVCLHLEQWSKRKTMDKNCFSLSLSLSHRLSPIDGFKLHYINCLLIFRHFLGLKAEQWCEKQSMPLTFASSVSRAITSCMCFLVTFSSPPINTPTFVMYSK